MLSLVFFYFYHVFASSKVSMLTASPGVTSGPGLRRSVEQVRVRFGSELALALAIGYVVMMVKVTVRYRKRILSISHLTKIESVCDLAEVIN